MKKGLATLLLTLGSASIAEGNVVWPALYTETKVSSVPIIVLGLAIEAFLFKWLCDTDWKKAIYYSVAANTASGVLGLFLRPLSGIAWELSLGALVMLLFDWDAFNPIAWFFVPLFGGAVNAAIELFTLKSIWKVKFTKRNFFALWAANWFTVGLATLWFVKYPPQM